MSIRDYIRCEVPLPDGRTTDELFLTDDFGREMAEHAIRADGIYRDTGRATKIPGYKPVPRDEGQSPFIGIMSNEGYTRQLCRLEGFSGTVNFREQAAPYREYQATFGGGALLCIEEIANYRLTPRAATNRPLPEVHAKTLSRDQLPADVEYNAVYVNGKLVSIMWEGSIDAAPSSTA